MGEGEGEHAFERVRIVRLHGEQHAVTLSLAVRDAVLLDVDNAPARIEKAGLVPGPLVGIDGGQEGSADALRQRVIVRQGGGRDDG